MERGVVLVTGGNSGIGFECSKALAKNGRKVLIASRGLKASEEAAAKICNETGAGSVSAMSLDLGSLASIRAFAKELEAKDIALSDLVCNAGLQVRTGPNFTADGFETSFGVNHLGHFLLTNLLLSRLAKNAPARIVVVASGVHDPALFTGMPKPAVTDIKTLSKTGGTGTETFSGQRAYSNSKLCNMWFMYELVRRLKTAQLDSKVTVNAYDPGLVPGSGLGRDYPAAMRFVWENIMPQMAKVVTHITGQVNPAPKAGAAMAKLVLDPELASTSGKYFPSHTRWKEAASSTASYDQEKARELWEESIQMTHLTAAESPLCS
jgi:light-dependent protochlorophyllide reductase